MFFLAVLQQTPSVPVGVVATVNRFTDFLLGYVGALAAVGALSMALTEAIKKLWDSRTKFQARRWIGWLRTSAFPEDVLAEANHRDAATRATSAGSTVPRSGRELALAELLQLCTGLAREEAERAARNLMETAGRLPAGHAFDPDPAHAVFALDLGRMMGSIQEAADVALAAPHQYPHWYLLVTAGADPRDVRQWYADGASSMADIATLNPTPEQRQAVKDRADRFARLRQVVKRRLDGFQLYTGDRWASLNQGAANVVGMIAMGGVLSWMRLSGHGVSPDLATILTLSLLGGILSPVAKDLVSALKRVKDG